MQPLGPEVFAAVLVGDLVHLQEQHADASVGEQRRECDDEGCVLLQQIWEES